MGLLSKAKKLGKKATKVGKKALNKGVQLSTLGAVDSVTDLGNTIVELNTLGMIDGPFGKPLVPGADEIDPVTGETVLPLPDDEEMLAAAARKFQRRFAGRGRTGTALSAATGGVSTLG